MHLNSGSVSFSVVWHHILFGYVVNSDIDALLLYSGKLCHGWSNLLCFFKPGTRLVS